MSCTKELTSKSLPNWETGGDLLDLAKTERVKVREWAERMAIVDYGTPAEGTSPQCRQSWLKSRTAKHSRGLSSYHVKLFIFCIRSTSIEVFP